MYALPSTQDGMSDASSRCTSLHTNIPHLERSVSELPPHLFYGIDLGLLSAPMLPLNEVPVLGCLASDVCVDDMPYFPLTLMVGLWRRRVLWIQVSSKTRIPNALQGHPIGNVLINERELAPSTRIWG